MSLRNSSLFCNTKIFNWGALQSHAKSLELPWPDSFYLMYLNTGCGENLKYSNMVFICKGSMWNASCAQATATIFFANGCSWETLFCGRECLIPGELEHPFLGFMLNVLPFQVILPALPLYQPEWSMSTAVRIISQKAWESIIQIL